MLNNASLTFGPGVAAGTVQGLQGSGSVVLQTTDGLTPTTLTTGGNNLNGVFSGVMSGSRRADQGGQRPVHPDRFHTYTGATTVSGGTLQVGIGLTGALIGSTSAISLANNATLAFNHADPQTLPPPSPGAAPGQGRYGDFDSRPPKSTYSGRPSSTRARCNWEAPPACPSPTDWCTG